jgi:hypothetical protein
MNSGQLRLAFVASLAAALLLGCNTATVIQSKKMTLSPAPRPTIIYVANFQFATNCVATASTNVPPNVSQKELAQLQEMMAQSLVEDLEKEGYRTARLQPDAPLPSAGWLIRGTFDRIDEGNPRKRALVGFGAGRENLRVICTVERLTGSHSEPLCELQTEAGARKLPGSVFTPVPMLIGMRFAEEADSLDRDIEKTAARITTEIRQQLKDAPREVAEVGAANPQSSLR